MLNPWFDLDVDPLFTWTSDMTTKLHSENYLILRGALEISDSLPSTPKTPEEHLENLDLKNSARSLRTIAKSLGRPFTNRGMKQEKYFVQQIFPLKGRENSDSAASSTKELDLHSEHAMFELMPDYIIITCLKNPDQVPTLISPFHEKSVEQMDIITLSNAFGSDELKYWKKTVLTADQNDRLTLRYDSIYQKFNKKQEREAFIRLSASLRANIKSIVLNPGDVCIIDNKRCVHGRAQFQAKFDGSDRWMLRTMILKQ